MSRLPLLSGLVLLVLALSVPPSAQAEMTTIDARWTGTIEIVREGTHVVTGAGGQQVAIKVRQEVRYELDGGEEAAVTSSHHEQMDTGHSTVVATGQGTGSVYAGAGFVDDGQGGRFYKRGWYVVTHGAPLATLVDIPRALEQVEVAPGVFLHTPDDYREQETYPITLVVAGATSLQALEGEHKADGLIQSVFLGNIDGTETITYRLKRKPGKA
ncbi:hypothetical protein [Cognatiluteimonas weifangensis]|uniref:DUF5666 domain-containing protein n=1 Tax=Cognatiluteimonas weifangensis TaxID=2303539 RepID=A0A372DQT1_9GAMM|nr:hypothetical protein [Luteimonas weifangensis]RFP61915.1 hypothetical protein D0Y53_02320 [Luteimonas weifangensis]